MKHHADLPSPSLPHVPVFERCSGCTACGWLCRRAAQPVRLAEVEIAVGPFLRARRRVARGFGQARRTYGRPR